MNNCVVIPLFICLFLISCSNSVTETGFSDKYLFFEEAEEQEAKERIWKKVSLKKIAEIPSDEETVLYNAGILVPDTNGDIYVVDYGVFEILRFDSNGTYVMSYGDGAGNAPGEFSSITDIKIASDSTIYVIDHSAKRISLFLKENGELIDTKSFTGLKSPMRYAATDSGIEYIAHIDSKKMFSSKFGENVVEFGELLENHDGLGLIGALVDGDLVTYKENMVYAFARFPLILIYDPDGNLILSKKTMAYGDDFQRPEVIQSTMNQMVTFVTEGEVVNAMMSVDKDKLFLAGRVDEDMVIDVYEAESADYEYSFKAPNYAYAFIMNDRMYQPLDTTVAIFSMEE